MKTKRKYGSCVIKKLKNILVLEFDVPNKNGRIYSSDCINLDDVVIKEKLYTRSFYGTIEVKEDALPGTVNLLDISHNIVRLVRRKNCLYADIDILDTPNGRILVDLLNKKIGGFRTTGTGNLTIDFNTSNQIVSDYTLDSISYFRDPA